MSTTMTPQRLLTRRTMLEKSSHGIGAFSTLSLLDSLPLHSHTQTASPAILRDSNRTYGHFRPRAKRVIYLFQSGGPSHIDLLDYKPLLKRHHGKDLPDSIRQGQRLTTMTSGQSQFPCVSSLFQFSQSGQSGAWISELLPHIGSVAHEITLIRSLYTEAINHDPAMTYINTGSQQLGHASMGSWISYGIGALSNHLPPYIVLMSQGTGRPGGQPLFTRLWGSGFLPSHHQGVRFRSGQDPVLYLSNPSGITPPTRRDMLNSLSELNALKAGKAFDPEIETRIAQYEMAYRMQTSIPDLVDFSQETEATFTMYGPNARTPGTFAANCLMARRMAERGVRFIQLFHRGWDQHGNLPSQIRGQAKDVDQPSAALLKDLKQRGLLEDTLVIWGGEFGRTVYCQGTLSQDNYGRDHHGRCFSVWMAGGGVKGGFELGETDDFGYNITRSPVHIHDLNATILHCLGIDHQQLSYRYQGLNHRLTGQENARVVHEILT